MSKMIRTSIQMAAFAGFMLLPISGAIAQDEPETNVHKVPGGGGLTLSVQEWGNPNGPAILFIHGWSQSHMTWSMQYDSKLADEFRMVTFDNRGHGRSDKPLAAENYNDSTLWAADVDAVIKARGLDRPVLVGHSYGGFIMTDYVRHYGEADISGIVMCGAATKIGTDDGAKFVDERFINAVPGSMSEDLGAIIDSVYAYSHTMAAKPLPQAYIDRALAFNFMVPSEVRLGLFSRSLDNDDLLQTLGVPVLIVHGDAEAIVKPLAAEHHHALIPNSMLSVYEGAGHHPFAEDPERFNQELAEFVRSSASM